MARLFLTRVQCNSTSGGQIRLRIGETHILMPYTSVDAAHPKTYGLGKEPWWDFCGSIVINLDNNSCSEGEGGGSTSSISAIANPSGTRIIGYRAEECSGNYTLSFRVLENFPGAIKCYVNGIARLAREFVELTAIFLLNILILIAAPFRRLFSRGDQPRE